MSSEAPPRPGLAGVAITAAGIVLAAAVVLAVPALRDSVSAAISGDTAEVRTLIDDLGFAGVLVVIALALIHAVVFYPAEILDAAVGFAYGFGPGLALVMACWLLSALVAYEIGRHAGRPLLYRIAGEERFERLERMIERGGVSLLLAVRLIPIFPFSITCYVCGAARVPLPRYIWTTAVGYLPVTAIFVYLGTQLESLSPTDPLLLAAGAVLIVLFALTRWAAPKLRHREDEPGEPSAQEARAGSR